MFRGEGGGYLPWGVILIDSQSSIDDTCQNRSLGLGFVDVANVADLVLPILFCSSSIGLLCESLMVVMGVSGDDLVNDCHWWKTVGKAWIKDQFQGDDVGVIIVAIKCRLQLIPCQLVETRLLI